MWSHHFMTNRWGKNENSDTPYFFGLQKSLQMVIAAMKLKYAPQKKSYDQPRLLIKNQTTFTLLLCQQRSILSKLWFFQ